MDHGKAHDTDHGRPGHSAHDLWGSGGDVDVDHDNLKELSFGLGMQAVTAIIKPAP
jgi:hypothetical protein